MKRMASERTLLSMRSVYLAPRSLKLQRQKTLIIIIIAASGARRLVVLQRRTLTKFCSSQTCRRAIGLPDTVTN